MNLGIPGRVTSPWEIACRGEISVIPWTCFSSVGCTDLEVIGPTGRMSARAVGAIVGGAWLDDVNLEIVCERRMSEARDLTTRQ